MHKKSQEASHQLANDAPDGDSDDEGKGRDEIRSESIATLRAKAQEHSAKVLEALGEPGSATAAAAVAASSVPAAAVNTLANNLTNCHSMNLNHHQHMLTTSNHHHHQKAYAHRGQQMAHMAVS